LTIASTSKTREKSGIIERKWNAKRSAQDLVCADSSDNQPFLGRLIFAARSKLDQHGHALHGYGSKKAGRLTCSTILTSASPPFFAVAVILYMMNQTGFLYARRSPATGARKSGRRGVRRLTPQHTVVHASVGEWPFVYWAGWRPTCWGEQ
jgi:hypothetical protein